jgi:tetratricopeptide (TPR) repeat protein
LGAAAQRALDRDDPSAAPLAGRALDCLPAGDAARAELLLVRCEALLSAADAVPAREAVTELERLAAPSSRLRAWAACFAAQLATFTDPAHLRETEQSSAAVAVELAALGDDRGAAKAHAVHAAALARLGRFAEVEEALDRALTAAHAAGDRRLATVALAAAPVAAVWGPSPVPRAGGRCLDVVRLLRITAGSPVVEATSLRCQAVLEAFRGRIDAARRLVASAHEMLMELGLVHGLLEADMFAAIVEIVAGDVEAADERLRRAYHGLRQLGAEADAARAAALLARVEMERGDLEEAERMAGQAEELAGDDLQAGIAWRRVQAEVLARRGHHDEAMALAEAAVGIASSTDALVQHADACLGLAAVQRGAGDFAGAVRSTREAAEMYGRKGATALVQSTQVLLSTAAPSVTSLPTLNSENQLTNAAVDAFRRQGELFARRDWGSFSTVLADDAQTDDRRPVTRARLDRTAAESYMRSMAEQGGASLNYRVLATRGDRLALLATDVSGHLDGPEFFSAGAVDVVEVTADGRITNTTLYPIDDVDLAMADLDHRYIQGEGAPFAIIFQLATDLVRAANARDWVAVGKTLAPDVSIHDHHSGGLAQRHGREETVEAVRQVSAEQPNARWTIRAIHELSSDVIVETVVISDGAAETMYHNVQHRGLEGIDRVDSFAAHDLDAALGAARLLRSGPEALSNRCSEVFAESSALFAKRDWEALREVWTEDAVFDDRRPVVRTLSMGRVSEVHARELAAQGVERVATTVLATRGDRLALIKAHGESRDSATELFVADESLSVLEITDSGRLCAYIGFAVDDLDSAITELDRRYLEGDGARYPAILSVALAGNRAIDRRDWKSFRACVTPDVVMHDHQWGIADARGRDALEQLGRAAMDTDPGSHLIVRRIHAVSDCAIAIENRLSHGAGDTYSLVHQVYRFGPAGIDRVEAFAPEALEDALAAFHRLPAPATDRLSNWCTDALARVSDHFASRDWNALTATLADDLVYQDHRSVIQVSAAGRGEVVASLQFQVEQRADRLVFTPVALRGAHLALVRVCTQSNVDADNSFASVMLAVIRSAADGRLDRITVYKLADENPAIAELDQCYIDGEGALCAPILSPALAAVRAINARDWDAWRAYVPVDAVLVEHYYRGWSGAAGRGASETMMRQAMDAIPDSRVMVRRIHAVCDSVLGYETRLSHGGSDALGEELFHSVVHLGPTGLDRVETFGPESLDEALACYRRLSGPVLETLSNRAVQTALRAADSFASRDWERYSQTMSDGLVYEDHRAVMRTEAAGRSEIVAGMQIAAEEGADRLVFTPLAVRGDHLALVQASFRSSTDAHDFFSSLMLAVFSSNDDDLVQSISIYDLDDEDRAISELDRRYVEGEGAPYATILSLAFACSRAMDRRDWQSLRACVAPEIVMRDHQWRLADATGPEQVEEVARRGMDTVPSSHVIVRRLHAVSGCALAFETGLLDGAGAASTVALHHQVAHLGPGGIDRVDTFGPDALDDALATYHRLAAPPLDTPSNRCTETLERLSELLASHAWEELIATWADDVVYEDERTVMRTRSAGRSYILARMQMQAQQGLDRLVFTPLAVRGSRLALVRLSIQSSADAEDSLASVVLGVASIAGDGRNDRMTIYDLDDEDRAIAELERRYIEGEGSPYAEIVTLLAGGIRALNQRDWDHLQGYFSPSVADVDHYSAGWNSRQGRADTLAAFIEFADSLPGGRAIVREIHACTTDALLCTTVWRGRSEQGGAVEFVYHVLCHRAGRVADHIETFGPDAVDDALAAYRRLTAGGAPGNRCTEVFGRWAERFAARDWEGLGALVTDDYIYVDNRPVIGLQEVGRDACRRTMQILAEQGGDRVVYTTIAVRGEQHALLRLGVQSDRDADDSFASVMLGVVSSSPDDRFASITVFGLDDDEQAIAELDRRYIEGEGAPYAPILSSTLAQGRAINRRDWEAFRAYLAPDVFVRDHQWGLVDATGRERVEEIARQMMDAVPGSRMIVRRIHTVSDGALAFETCRSLGSGTASMVDTSHQVAHLGPSGIDRVESFGPDALDDALAAYRRLAAKALDVPTNRCTETFRLICDHFAARAWDAFTASMSEGYVYDDHRSVVSVQTVGRSDALAHMQIAAESGADRLLFTALAVRGANHALVRLGTQSNADAEDSFGSVMLAVISNTNDGRHERTTIYDLDDEDRAIDELERRYIEGEGAPYAEMLTLFAEGTRALNERDWDHFRARFSPAAAQVDHYSAGWDSRRGGADILAAFIEFAGSLSGARTIVREIHACTTDALLATTVVSGRSEDGGDVEFVFHVVCHRAGRVLDHTESFSSDALHDALAAYRRLTGDAMPGNRCTQMFGRWAAQFAARDWDGLDALVTDDILHLDHRPVVGLREVGRDASRRTMQILAEQGGDRVVYTVLATRGERHALLRLGVQSDRDADDSFASVHLGVVTSSSDDRFASITVFGLDEEERARAELERQYEQAQGRPSNP